MSASSEDKTPALFAQHLSLALSAAELGEWAWDLVSDDTHLSPKAKEILGLPPNASTKRSVLREILSAEDRERAQRTIEAAIKSGGDYRIEYKIHPPGCEPRWVATQGKCLTNAEGKPIGMVGVVQDITEKVKTAAALRDARERLEATLSAAEVGTWTWDIKSNIVIADQNLAALFFQDPTRTTGTPVEFLSRIHPEDRPRMEAATQAAMVEGRIDLDYRVVRPDGSERWLISRGQLERDSAGEPIRLPGIVIDITERKRAEAITHRQHHVLQLLTEDLPLKEILTALIQLVEEDADEKARGSVLLMAEDGKHLLHGAAPGLPDAYNNAINGMEIGPSVGSCGSAAWSGKPVYVSDIATDPLWAPYRELPLAHNLRACWSCPILSSAGKVLGTFAMYYSEPREPQEADFRIMEAATRTASIAIERKRAEQALRKSRDEAEAANRAKDRFLAVLSHELRTPLTPVVMVVGALQADPNLPPELREYMEMIRRNLDLEITLIDDMLDLSRIMSGKLRLKMENLAINPLVEEACAICRQQITEKAIHLDIKLTDQPGTIQGDPARLQQILWNVLKNAAKFTPTGGRIAVTTALVNGKVEIRVSDSGVGIAPDALPKIFDAFEQASSKLGGLGLGLAISKALVELHGGSIHAESGGIGHGSTFVIQMPATIIPARPVAQEHPPHHLAAGGLRVLVVEDHLDTATVLCRLLKSAGYAVSYAGCLAEARDLAATHEFDVLISDIGLPDGNGYELMNELRDRDLIGIAMSGYGMDEDLRRSRAAGFSDHLVKPVDVAMLLRTVQGLLAGKESHPSEMAAR